MYVDKKKTVTDDLYDARLFFNNYFDKLYNGHLVDT